MSKKDTGCVQKVHRVCTKRTQKYYIYNTRIIHYITFFFLLSNLTIENQENKNKLLIIWRKEL